MSPEPPPLTYAAAGVDIDARRRFIERIRPIAQATHRPEVLAGVGPFGGLFQLGAYRAPVLVSSTDSVGTKVRIATLLGRYDTIGVDDVMALPRIDTNRLPTDADPRPNDWTEKVLR